PGQAEDLGAERGYLALQLFDLALMNLLLLGESILADGEQFALCRDEVGKRLAGHMARLGRNHAIRKPEQVRLEPRPRYQQPQPLLTPRTKIGRGAGFLKGDQNVALAHLLPLANMDTFDNPALQVLDNAAARIRTDHAGGNGAAGERGQGRPAAEDAEKDQDDDETEDRS